MKETNSNQRVLEILRMLIEQPGRYTKNELAKIYGRNPDTIKRDFEDLRNAGFHLKHDSNYRYFLIPEKTTAKVNELSVLTGAEFKKVREALGIALSESEASKIIDKIQNFNTIPRLGNTIFNKPYLHKVQLLSTAMEMQRIVILHDYKSTNSNRHRDRAVEPFHLATENDMLHAYDLGRDQIRHFRLGRIGRIEITEEPAIHQSKHHVVATDIFNIAEDRQESVHIRLHLGGYNELLERYPLSRAYLYPAANEDNIYELVCKVNYQFYGLQNFLLGNSHFVQEILGPERLRKQLREYVRKIKIF
ncbi:WYL domain-containing protein [Marinilongibacter aquaticus]|uniref:helix-turn-helix transcriptional regulator n=1 Tax=Marinilongibacter aquaticus TaxID=2975157 RepID=UPI0021BDAE3C|nr:WYL domain-containing protein [Marinilongibacter aquaticus]UBM60785.1 WYL domain-containing protein [Marinilongibacter aquaticus]